MARFEALDALRVIAMHPVAQRLALHAGPLRRFGPGVAIQNERQGQQAPNLSAIAAFRRERAQFVRGVVGSCDGERTAHSILLRPSIGLRGSNRSLKPIPSPEESQRFGRLVLCGEYPATSLS